MKTVDKAMSVLAQFSVSRTEIGLSEIARLANLDKAATRRLLVSLIKHGYIEQRTDTRQYRLGNGFLNLARVREATVPLNQAAKEVSEKLSATTDETVHINIPTSESMTTIAYTLPLRGNVINIIPSQPLPFHATASGIAYLSFATPDRLKRALTISRREFTAHTSVTKADLIKQIKQTQANGFSYCRNTFEDGIASLAMPFFLDGDNPGGTIAIATHSQKMTTSHRAALIQPLADAITQLQNALLGDVTKRQL